MKTMYLVLLLAAFPAAAHAQSSPIRGTGSFFALFVENMDVSTAWYAETLGLNVVMRVPSGENPAVTVLEGDGLMVELVESRGESADKVPPGQQKKPRVPGVMKAGFMVADFDGTIAALRARGVQFEFGPFPPRRDQRANAIFKDNAGNLIQVIGGFAP